MLYCEIFCATCPATMSPYFQGACDKNGISRGEGVHCVSRFWKIQRGGEVIGKIPSGGGGGGGRVWIFSGTT